jgi:lipoprotein-anchoring transpeptidase ErfK/SrfK
MMHRIIFATLLAAFFWAFVPASDRAEASVLVQINRGTQTMAVTVDGAYAYTWRVSTARQGYITPPGTYHPHAMARMWYSKIYYNSPMPHSIFFYGGFAIHGTYDIARLGGPASHGCVRLDPNHAAILYGLVAREGMRNTTIVVQ